MARKILSDLDASDVKRVFWYDQNSGAFIKKASGKITGSCPNGTYVHIRVNGRQYLAHRLAWLYVYGKWPARLIDHIDGQPRNNAIWNLREVDDVLNHQNTKCRGFYFDSRSKKYVAQITVRGKRHYFGPFSTPEDARAAYEAASVKFFGEFSGIHRGMK